MRKKQERILVGSLDEIPRFASEDEERDWWATHDLADELWEPATTEDLALLEELGGTPRIRPPVQLESGG
jgi:hypothetical protein